MHTAIDIMMVSLHSDPLSELGRSDNGGMSVFLRETAGKLAERGHRIDIITAGKFDVDGDVEIVSLLQDDVRLVRLPAPSHKELAKEQLVDHLPILMESLNAFIQKSERGYGLVHSHYWVSGAFASLIKKRYQLPHCHTFHTIGEVKNRECPGEAEPSVRLSGEKDLMDQCDHLIAFTEMEKRDLLEIGTMAEENISIVPCGVNLQQFKRVNGQRIRDELGVEKAESMLLLVGRFVPIKGVEAALQAVRNLPAGSNCKLVLVGGEEENSLLHAQVAKANMQNLVIFAGRVDRDVLPEYYSAADAVLIPSYHESFSLVALEALACGTPVIANGVGGIPQLFRPGCGMILESNDHNRIAEAISDLMVKKRVVVAPPEEIREAVKGYSWVNTSTLLERVYSDLVNKAGGIL